jgi:hypothetical protein
MLGKREFDAAGFFILNYSYLNKTLSVDPIPAKEREFCLTKLGRAAKNLPHKQNRRKIQPADCSVRDSGCLQSKKR